MDKIALAQKINSLSGLSKEEKAELTQLLNTKRYGLVWEDKPEDVEEELKTKLPILQEVTERKVIGNSPVALEKTTVHKTIEPQISLDFNIPSDTLVAEENTSDPTTFTQNINHTLIEGDNLHALTVLNYTHANKIDVIYIDPPYNTGNKDFKYNDSFVDKEDGYRHSKWLSFMAKRLRLAKNLLSDKGVIFISIDDNEQAQLKLLCDEVFGERNFIEDVIWKNKYGAGAKTTGFISVHEHIICYSKNQLKNIDVPLSLDEQTKYNKKDDKFELRGGYMTQPLMTKSLGDRVNLMYSIFYNGEEIIPDKQWVWSKERLELAIQNNEVVFNKEKGKWSVRSKQYLKDEFGTIRRGKPTSLLNGPFTQEGTDDLRQIFGKEPFGFPKPVNLVKYFISLRLNDVDFKNATVLDFFAGSGTTLHAVMALNAEDGGSRQCILVTNNENNICEEVTYERNKRVIEGYTNAKGDFVAGLGGNNLRYYRTGYVGRERTLKNKKALVSLATEMLCLKEGVYQEKNIGTGFIRVFEENDKAFMIIYDEEYIDDAILLIQQIEIPNPIKVYIFANGQYPYTEDFEEVLDKIELCALPDAIYRAYQRLLPKEE